MIILDNTRIERKTTPCCRMGSLLGQVWRQEERMKMWIPLLSSDAGDNFAKADG